MYKPHIIHINTCKLLELYFEKFLSKLNTIKYINKVDIIINHKLQTVNRLRVSMALIMKTK